MQIDRDKRSARFAAHGRLLPDEAAELASGALAAACAEGLRTLMINFKDIALTRRFSVEECHAVGEQLARAGAGLRKVALVARAECVEANAFLLTVAQDCGLPAAAFPTESEALRWLQLAPGAAPAA